MNVFLFGGPLDGTDFKVVPHTNILPYSAAGYYAPASTRCTANGLPIWSWYWHNAQTLDPFACP